MTQTGPRVGDPAPDFTLPGDGGSPIALSDYRGKPLVLYFYPKDDTPTCTTQARDFASSVAEFDRIGCAVLGVSMDSVKKHDKFRAKFGLGFRLVSDAEGSLCQSYGVWGEKTMYGRTYMGIIRTTFLIGADGRIAAVWTVARVKGHVDDVLAAARVL